jgi:hypothetical protein
VSCEATIPSFGFLATFGLVAITLDAPSQPSAKSSGQERRLGRRIRA